MQQEDLEHRDDATTHASKSHDKTMKPDEAQRMAKQVIAEEAEKNPRSAVTTYFIAAIIGLIIWAAIYFLWLKV